MGGEQEVGKRKPETISAADKENSIENESNHRNTNKATVTRKVTSTSTINHVRTETSKSTGKKENQYSGSQLSKTSHISSAREHQDGSGYDDYYDYYDSEEYPDEAYDNHRPESRTHSRVTRRVYSTRTEKLRRDGSNRHVVGGPEGARENRVFSQTQASRKSTTVSDGSENDLTFSDSDDDINPESNTIYDSGYGEHRKHNHAYNGPYIYRDQYLNGSSSSAPESRWRSKGFSSKITSGGETETSLNSETEISGDNNSVDHGSGNYYDNDNYGVNSANSESDRGLTYTKTIVDDQTGNAKVYSRREFGNYRTEWNEFNPESTVDVRHNQDEINTHRNTDLRHSLSRVKRSKETIVKSEAYTDDKTGRTLQVVNLVGTLSQFVLFLHYF